jgi:hypothetical protein
VVVGTDSGRTCPTPSQEHNGIKQAARIWHNHISDWMINNGYLAVNSEKTIFKKIKGSDHIIHAYLLTT